MMYIKKYIKVKKVLRIYSIKTINFQTNILILYGQRFGLLKKLKQIL